MGPQLEFRTIQSLQHLTLMRVAHHDSLLEFGQVEGMQRLAGFQKNVVGHIDHIVDRPQPRGHQAVGQPLRTGPDIDPADDPRGVKGTAGILQPDKAVRRFLRDGRRRSQYCFDFGQSRHLSSHTAVAEQIRSVRSHLQFEHRVGRKEVLHRSAHRKVSRQNEQAIRIFGQRQLLGTA